MKRLFTALIGVGLIASLYGYDKSGYYPDPLSLTGNGTISGSWTVGGNIFVSQRAKIGLDGVSGNSYIMSDTGDMMKFYTGGAKTFEIGTSSVSTVGLNLYTNSIFQSAGSEIQTGWGIYFKQVADVTTKLYRDTQDDTLKFVLNGTSSRNILDISDSYYTIKSLAAQTHPTIIMRPTGSPIGVQGKYGKVYCSGDEFAIDSGSQTKTISLKVNNTEVLEVATSSVTVKQPLYTNGNSLTMGGGTIYQNNGVGLYWAGGDSAIIGNAGNTLGLYVTDLSNAKLSVNKNTVVIKSSSTAGLAGTTPVVVGEIYYNSNTNKICVSTGTTKGAFGSMAVGDYFK
jgi:hypothetical protein